MKDERYRPLLLNEEKASITHNELYFAGRFWYILEVDFPF